MDPVRLHSLQPTAHEVTHSRVDALGLLLLQGRLLLIPAQPVTVVFGERVDEGQDLLDVCPDEIFVLDGVFQPEIISLEGRF